MLLLSGLCAQERDDQVADMVFKGPNCIQNIQILPSTEFIAPMVHGKPDLKNGTFDHLKFSVNMNCGFYRVRKLNNNEAGKN